ncbi:MAG: tetratricopeptide repeat protein [Paludibacter sp.]|nr:tetratricopeptide repeat protein [Paludibacter sp.]
MKKIILSLILAISFTFAFAQKANVSKARNKALMETPDFAGAREAIKLALKDSTTNKLAETWYVAGLIGNKENDLLYQKALLNQAFDKDVKGQAIMESYAYFLKAAELDKLPDAKGKVKEKYAKDIKAKIQEYYKIQQNLISYGAYLYEKKNYDGAVNAFETYLEIPKLPMMNNELKPDSTYRMIQYYTCIGAINGGKHEKAIAHLEDLKDKNYETLTVYQLLYEEYVKQKDTVNYVKTLKEGLQRFPSDAWFLQNLINYYIYSGKSADALVYLKTAIEREPNMAQYRYVKGNLDESLGNTDEALASFDKAIQLDSTLAEAWGGKGRLYYNKAVKMSDEANKIKDNKLYNAESKKVDAAFKVSIPYFKKASALKPKEREYKQTLKTLYYRLKMDADFEAVKKDLDAM